MPRREWAGCRTLLRGATGNVALVLCSIVLTFVIFELGCRLARGPSWLLHWPNLVWAQRAEALAADHAYEYDPALGWRLRPGYTAHGFSVDTDGFRTTPSRSGLTDEPPLLVLGGSHVEGTSVADGETFPAGLQEALNARVINGGVASYGVDQSLLQAEKIVGSMKPRQIVLAFSGGNILNLELSRASYAEKPYFELNGGKLALRNTPTPRPISRFGELPVAQRLLGWSMSIPSLLGVDYRAFWYGLDRKAPTHGAYGELICPVMARFARLGVPSLAVAIVDRDSWVEAQTYGADQRRASLMGLDCARQAGMATLDLFEPMRRAVEAEGLDALYGRFHHSPHGNRLVARAIAEALR